MVKLDLLDSEDGRTNAKCTRDIHKVLAPVALDRNDEPQLFANKIVFQK